MEDQRHYLETVLSQLSTGVLTLDENGRLFTNNKAASQILRVALDDESGKTLAEISRRHPHLQPLEYSLQARALKSDPTSTHADDWREEIILLGSSGRQILMCSSTPLSASGDFFAGRVVVFDDVTDLIQAQRNAAWSEVARRLAHEIKNPLTPIQLSAERLRHKYLGKMQAEDGDALDRLTRTIVQQVEAMKTMVNAFSDYARAPRMQLRDVDVNELITDVVELYRAGDSEIDLETALADDLPLMEADTDRLRQILHNLIKNALEASPSDGTARVRIETALREGAFTKSDRDPNPRFRPWSTREHDGRYFRSPCYDQDQGKRTRSRHRQEDRGRAWWSRLGRKQGPGRQRRHAVPSGFR